MCGTWAATVCLCLSGSICSETLTLPLDERPAWLRREGIVMAWSMEPLLFRVRRAGRKDFTPTPEERAAYLSEYSPEMLARLKALGVNFVMIHCYKGAGLEAERQSMAEAVEFSRRLRTAGFHVAVYVYSGAFLWEPFFTEMPQAKDWVLLDAKGKPVTYGRATYRYRWNRNHPGAQAFYRKIVRFAVEEIRTDLIHFDNYIAGPGRDANSVNRFRRYLKDTFTPERLARSGIKTLEAVQPPMRGPEDNFLRRAWLAFCSQSLSDSYHDMCRYARTFRKDILVECNPQGPGSRIRAPVDHGRLLQGGEAFWDEGVKVGYDKGNLNTRIRTYKVARRMDNMAFAYVNTPLDMAEAMAFNLDCLGAICEFEYGEIHARTGPVLPSTKPFIQFFHGRRDLLRDARVVADVAVLRSFPSQVFADPVHASLTYGVEKAFIENRIPLQIIYDHHLAELERYRVLVLAGCVALSDRHVDQITQYVRNGGRVCVAGSVGTHDEWMERRDRSALGELPASTVVRVADADECVEALRRTWADKLSLSVHVEPMLPEWQVAVGMKPYTDRSYALTGVPGELIGLHTIRFSHTGAKRDASLRFRANMPVRAYVAFAPTDIEHAWLDRPPGWRLYKKAALKTTMSTFGAVMDIHYRDLPAGEVQLFDGMQGNYVLVGIAARDKVRTEPSFVTQPIGLCVELTEQVSRRLVHLVNYRSDRPFKNVGVRLRLPAGRRAKAVVLASPERQDDVRLPFKATEGVVAFSVPNVSIYEIAAVEYE